jgi:hypothetical protein
MMTKKSKKSKNQSESSAKQELATKIKVSETEWATSYKQLITDYDDVFKELAKQKRPGCLRAFEPIPDS